ncbi:Ionotropic glutamate receptor plant protein [Dioscorea alata]|uniref:Ionotropic glutamate receptor plant protein n=1 Tax=Dioscorea alata TaxID=55571 RepID=A0ACB7WUE8_DIOAL|nr:Ionotropic glutamate receptor plant protein [Dioscorea alata]
MRLMYIFTIITIYHGLLFKILNVNADTRPTIINVGVVFNFNSTIGEVAAIAIQAGVDDVNADPTILQGSKLAVMMHDDKCNGFTGMVEVLKLMGKQVVGVVGPQCSIIANIISHIAKELKVPLLSFAATDPTISSLQYPYFIRTTLSDAFQMQAVSNFINYYQWRQVIAIFMDDEYGRNGIIALADMLAEIQSKISFKVALPQDANPTDIASLLAGVVQIETRIIILHANELTGVTTLTVAQSLGMMKNGYVWIVTDWLASVLDSRGPLAPQVMQAIQGVVFLRQHIEESAKKTQFVSRWSKLVKMQTKEKLQLNSYGLYAYDSVWVFARALDEYLNDGGNISFSSDPNLQASDGRSGHLNRKAMSIFNGGEILLEKIKDIRTKGVTGLIQFDHDGNRIHPAYEIVNVIDSELKIIGYWSNYSRLSINPPEKLYNKHANYTSISQRLKDVVWPGRTTLNPRDRVFLDNGKKLRIAVPNRVSFRQFVSRNPKTGEIEGYVIDIFTTAIKLLPYHVSYNFILFGDGQSNPNYMDFASIISSDEFDGAVGDIAIVTNRTSIVDFTLPFIETGAVVVTPVKKYSSNAWSFTKPFMNNLWFITVSSFLFVGVVMWVLEHHINEEFSYHDWKKQIVAILSFSISTAFFRHKKNVRSTLGKILLIIWLFVVLIIQSSYKASLTSILTLQQLSTPIRGINSLIETGYPIGYQKGSYLESYMVEELGIPRSRLRALGSPEEYAKALELGPNNGGVAAVVDERPYIELFLSTYCQFTIVGSKFTKAGWGFAFPRNSQFALDMSTAILKLSDNGELQRIHNKWLTNKMCNPTEQETDSKKLHLSNFWGLFVITGISALIAILSFLSITFYHYVHEFGKGTIKGFISYVNSTEEHVQKKLKEKNSQRSNISGVSNTNA